MVRRASRRPAGRQEHTPVVTSSSRAFIIVACVAGWMTWPAHLVWAVDDESPYQAPPPPDSGGLSVFAPLENLPVWAQAALFSAAISVAFLILFEMAQLLWERRARYRGEWFRR